MPISSDKNRIFIDRTSGEGISIRDVRTVLVSSSTDVGTLCSHENINLWAKYRPISMDVITGLGPNGTLTDAQRASKNWGWVAASAGNVSALVTPYLAEEEGERLNGWVASLPKGVIPTSPYRLLDFDGYCHVAKPPVLKYTVGTMAVNNNPNSGIELAIIPQFKDQNNPSVTFDEIAESLMLANGLYLGFVMFNGNVSGAADADGRVYAIATADTPISVTEDSYSGFRVKISTNNTASHPWNGRTGDYSCFAFLSPVRIQQVESWHGSVPQSVKYTIPILSPWTAVVKQGGGAGQDGTLEPTFKIRKTGYNQLAYELTVVNAGSVPYTMHIAMWVRKATNPSPLAPDGALEAGEFQVFDQVITLNPGESWSRNEHINVSDPAVYRNCVAWLQVFNDIFKYFILSPMPDDDIQLG